MIVKLLFDLAPDIFYRRRNSKIVIALVIFIVPLVVLARFIDASRYFHAIRIAIHFARITILSANRAISRDDIH